MCVIATKLFQRCYKISLLFEYKKQKLIKVLQKYNLHE